MIGLAILLWLGAIILAEVLRSSVEWWIVCERTYGEIEEDGIAELNVSRFDRFDG